MFIDPDDEETYPLFADVDPKLIRAISQGQYIDLVKLMMEDDYSEQHELVDFAKKFGLTFLILTMKAKAQLEKKIDSLDIWLQTFRVYHSVYVYFKMTPNGVAGPPSEKPLDSFVDAANVPVWNLCP